ncbi:MAG: hybrid sensor histidine kinase/response regulator [Chloroflexota bacterium]
METLAKIRLEVDPELRLSPLWVSVALISLFLALIIAEALVVDVEPNNRFSLRLMTLLCLIIAAVIGGLQAWRHSLSRWLMLLLLLVGIQVAFTVLGMSSLLLLLILPPLLATALINWPAAVVIGFVETSWLLWQWPTLTARGGDAVMLIAIMVMIWTMLGLLLAIIYPLVQRTHWSDQHFHDAQQKLEETRDQKVRLAQMQEDLKAAYQTQEILNERLAILNQVAEEAHQAKTAFVAKISHEFRTPLNMILGMIDTLREVPEAYGEPIPARLLSILEIVQRNSDHLAEMINDVLDLSQAEAGQLTLHRAWVNLATDIENALRMIVLPLIEKKGLHLKIEIADDFPQVYCDRTRIRQVVLNLVSNAARYTETGSIEVKATRQGPEVCISVRDTGPGISPRELARIFEPFAQAEQVKPEQGSSGLGLSICKLFIDRHQGRIWVESELNSGSTFSFTLPITPRESSLHSRALPLDEDWVWHERAAWPQMPEIPRNQRIMICDESGDLAPMLTRLTDEIQFAESRDLPGALERLQNHPAHMLILNAAAPHHLISLLEEAQQTIPDKPIIGCAFPPEINYALEAGAVSYLIKPVRQPDLAEALRTLDKPVKRILLVDDNPDIRQLFTGMLSIIDPTLEIIPVASGAKALAELQHRARGSEAPDLVLLDIRLPDMLGWQVLAEKNQDGAIRDIPVIVISGEELVAWPTRSSVLLATMGAGIPINKLLPCSRQLAALLMKPDGEFEAVV